jgi:hypothetical protein
VIGAYQGASQYEFGIYRPSQDSLMRNLDKPFNLIGLAAMDTAIASKDQRRWRIDLFRICVSPAPAACPRAAPCTNPTASYYYANAGTHRACLDGPTGARLQPLPAEVERLQLADRRQRDLHRAGRDHHLWRHRGYYIYQLRSVTGSGSYTFAYTSPVTRQNWLPAGGSHAGGQARSY